MKPESDTVPFTFDCPDYPTAKERVAWKGEVALRFPCVVSL